MSDPTTQQPPDDLHLPFIVVGVDGSDASIGAALWAAGEAQRRGVAIRLVHAYAIPPFGGRYGVPEQVVSAVQDRATAALVGAAAAIRAAFPGLAISSSMTQESPVTALREASASALLIVVGSHGEHQLTEALLGSVAARVAEHAHGAVVVIRASDALARHPETGPVIVGLDGAPESEQALAFAFEEASMRRVGLIAVRAWDNGALDGFLGLYPLVIDPVAVDEQERQLLTTQLTVWTSKYPEVAVQPLVLRGRPSAVLLKCCNETEYTGRRVSLVVVGTHGRSDIGAALMGSTSRALIARAQCAVAVVRTG